MTQHASVSTISAGSKLTLQQGCPQHRTAHPEECRPRVPCDTAARMPPPLPCNIRQVVSHRCTSVTQPGSTYEAVKRHMGLQLEHPGACPQPQGHTAVQLKSPFELAPDAGHATDKWKTGCTPHALEGDERLVAPRTLNGHNAARL